MDLTDTIVPRSDQLNAEDLLTGPRTVTITEVHKGASAEQPVDIVLDEFGPARPFKPSKTVRRILVAAWGPDAATYAGRRMTIYRDPLVKFGGMDVGGIRISHLSHIAKPMTLALTVTRGKRAPYVVQPLADAASAATATTPPVSSRHKSPPDEPPTDAITPAQLTAVNAGLTALGITDRDAKLATVGQIIDREIGSSKELSRAEASAVLDWIAFEQQRDETPEPGSES